MASEKEVALYYPYIDIDDASLIKTAALYWDEIQTIVPQDIEDPYNNQATLDAERVGFLKSRDVMWDDEAVEQAGNEFVDDVENISEIRNVLLRQPNLHLHRSKVYDGKISLVCRNKLLDYFRENIQEAENASVMPEILAHSYMSRLASAITSNDGSVPITDSHNGHNILISRFVDYSQERRESQAQLVTLSLQTLSINPQASLIEVLRFRDKHHEELLNYRKYIRKLAWQISKGLDTAEKQSLFENMIKDEIVPAISDIETKLKSRGTFFMVANTAIMVTTIGSIIATGGQAWLGSFLPATVSLGLNFYGNIRAERAITDKPVGYLYKAQQQLGGGD